MLQGRGLDQSWDRSRKPALSADGRVSGGTPRRSLLHARLFSASAEAYCKPCTDGKLKIHDKILLTSDVIVCTSKFYRCGAIGLPSEQVINEYTIFALEERPAQEIKSGIPIDQHARVGVDFAMVENALGKFDKTIRLGFG